MKQIMTAESPETLFSRIRDRESLYDTGTFILGIDDKSLTELQRDFKHCYDLWLGLGNGFLDVCRGTYLTSLPRGIAAFDRIGATVIAIPGRLVLAEFESRNRPVSEQDIDEFTSPDRTEIEQFYHAIEEIDRNYINSIWDAASFIEQQLIALASGSSQPNNTEQSDADTGQSSVP